MSNNIDNTPLSLGFDPKFEFNGKIKKGNDNKLYQIHIIKGIKQWKLFTENFDNLPNDCYNNVYYPEIELIDTKDETGLEEKFGGSVPFFVNGEKYPKSDEDNFMTFLGQIKDPRDNNNILYRIFINENPEYNAYGDYEIMKIELNDENINNQQIIKPDNYLKFEPYKINNWKQSKELIDLPNIINRLSLEECEYVSDLYDNNDHYPSSGIKVGGTPMYCQYNPTIDYKNLFLQLSDCKQLLYSWGDAGIAHIDKNGVLEWDFC